MAKNEAGQVAGTAAQHASAVADTAKAGGQQVASEAKAQLQQVSGQARDQVETLVSRSREELQGQASTQVQRGAAGLRSLSDQLFALAEGRTQDAGDMVQWARQGGQKLAGYAERLERGGPQTLFDDTRRFAARRPGMYLLAAAAAGFAVGRLARGAQAAGDGSRSQGSDGEVGALPAGSMYGYGTAGYSPEVAMGPAAGWQTTPQAPVAGVGREPATAGAGWETTQPAPGVGLGGRPATGAGTGPEPPPGVGRGPAPGYLPDDPITGERTTER